MTRFDLRDERDEKVAFGALLAGDYFIDDGRLFIKTDNEDEAVCLYNGGAHTFDADIEVIVVSNVTVTLGR